MAGILGGFVLVGYLLQLLFLGAKAAPDWMDPDMLEMVKPDKEKCMTLHGTTEDMIDDVNKGILPNDRRITCYMHCLFEAFGLIDEDGNLETEMVVSLLPENMQAMCTEIMNKCVTQVSGGDNCEKIYVIGSCVQKEKPELWFMI